MNVLLIVDHILVTSIGQNDTPMISFGLMKAKMNAILIHLILMGWETVWF